MKYCKALSSAHVKKTIMQVALNSLFFQRLLGMSAGLPCFSCHPTQRTNVGRRTMDTAKRTMMYVSERLW